MRLMIREYLSMLKEDGELDRLLPDLLLAMNLEPLSRPRKGVRQYGVDLPAIGVDLADGRRKLFLVTIKRGDLNRDVWDAGKQAVRPSLNEILDTYLRTLVLPEHRDLPKKIIVAISGDLRQDVQLDWAGFVERHSKTNDSDELIEIELWHADRIASLIEQNLLTEHVFPESSRKCLRKTIALADQPEQEPRSFYQLAERTIGIDSVAPRAGSDPGRRQKLPLCTMNFAVNVVHHWCREADNLKTPLLAAERTLLLTWDWLRRADALGSDEQRDFLRSVLTYIRVAVELAAKLEPHCMVRDGLAAQGLDDIEYPLRVFEVSGYLSTLTLVSWDLAQRLADEGVSRSLSSCSEIAGRALGSLLRRNPGALSPLFDDHSIEIALALLALTRSGQLEIARWWTRQIAARILVAYELGHHFPISSDSFEDLIAVRLGKGPPKEKLFELSTIIPLLGDWLLLLGLDDAYIGFQRKMDALLPNVALQMWFPDQATDASLYCGVAPRETGRARVLKGLPSTVSGLRRRWETLISEERYHEDLSCFKYGWPVLSLVASRHYRVPVIPALWLPASPEPEPERQGG